MTNNHPLLLIDTHVHIHSCFDLNSFFDSALKNFKRAFHEINNGHSHAHFIGVLMLTETSESTWFQDMLNEINRDENKILRGGGWSISKTKEEGSLQVTSAEASLYLIAGRQIVTKERLEVLGLGMFGYVEDGLPISDVIDLVHGKQGLAILPWGFGKWIGKRGKIISDLIDHKSKDDIMIGDNSGRTYLLRTPSHFNTAAKKGMRILPGSDPLPFRSQFKKPGSFGVALNSEFDSTRPSETVKCLLKDFETTIFPYGNLENPINFIINQIRMQIRNRF